MNNTIKTIYQRRAIRKYKDKPVPHELIEQVIDAGRMAPSAHNEQTWKFNVLTDKKRIKAFSDALKLGVAKGILKSGLRKTVKLVLDTLPFRHEEYAKASDIIFYGAPVVIFLSSVGDSEWNELEVGMCAQNMMLAARSLGLDSCPIGSAKYLTETKLYSQLKPAKKEKLHLAVILGYGAEKRVAFERKKDDVVFID